MTKTEQVTFVEAPASTLEVIPIELINDVPAPTSMARQTSLIKLGQVDPVRLRPGGDGRFDIVDGRRRVANAKVAGLDTVTALVEIVTDTQAAFNALALNVSRSHSPMTEARLITDLLKHHTQQEIAKMLGVTQAFISQRLSLLDLVPDLQRRLEVGKMTLTAARAARKLSKEAQRELAKVDKITVQSAKDMLRQYQAEMIDLSAINIPDLDQPPPAPPKVTLSQEHLDRLAAGEEVTVQFDGRPLLVVKG